MRNVDSTRIGPSFPKCMGGAGSNFVFCTLCDPGTPKMVCSSQSMGPKVLASWPPPAGRMYFAGCPAESLGLVGGASLWPRFRPAIQHGLLVAARGYVSKRVFAWGLAHKSQRGRAILGSQPHAFVLGQKYLVNPGIRLLNLRLCGV